MRILVVTVLAVIALASAGVWALGEYGGNFTSSPSEAREPLVREPEAVVASAEPATPAPPRAPAKPKPSKSAAAKESSKPAETAAAAPPPAQPAAPQATPEAAAPTASAEAAPAAPAAPAKPNPFRSSLDATGPAQIFPPAPERSAGAPAAAAPPPQADTSTATASSAPAAPAASAPAAPQAAPQSTARAEPIVKPQQVEASAPTATATTATAAAPAGDLAGQYRSRKLTYNRPPEKLALDKTIDIALIIDSTGQNQAADAMKNLPGTVVERNVDLSDFVAAELKGNDFDIVLQSVAARQKLSPRIANEWRWRVTPRATGQHTLTLTVYGYASGSLDGEPLDSYRDDIVVEVQQLDQVINWAKGVQPVFAVLAAMAGAISAGVAFLRFRDERKAKKKAAS